MNGSPLTASGLLHVTVASGTRRVDLALPGTVPLAELVPELARSLGVLDVATAHGGYRLVLPDGRRLGLESSLVSHGVPDGSFLTLTAVVGEPPPRLYDDAVEAMADAVEGGLTPWQPEHARRAAVAAAALSLTLGAGALLLQRQTWWAAPGAALVAAVLLGAAIALSRAHVRRERWIWAGVAWLAVAYAAVSGLDLTWPGLGDDGGLLGVPLASAGGAVLLAGCGGMIALAAEGRTLLLPAVIVGALLLGAGLIVDATGWDAAVVLTMVLVAVVLVSSAFPRLALAVTPTDRLAMPDAAIEPAPIDATRVAADMRLAHQILLGLTATVGLLVVLVVPFAVSLGGWGALLSLAACAVVMLRVRQHRSAEQVLVGLVLAILALTLTVAAALVLHPSWRPAAALGLVAAGVLALASTMLPATGSLRRGRLGDLVEAGATLALPPLLVLASGGFAAVRR